MDVFFLKTLLADADFLKFIESKYPDDPLPHAVDVVLSFVNGVQALYNEHHLQPSLTLTVVQLDILSDDYSSSNKIRKKRQASQTEQNSKMDEPVADDDIMNYLKNFCSWAAKRNPDRVGNGAGNFMGNVEQQAPPWDHALLITGRDLMIDGKLVNNEYNSKIETKKSFFSQFLKTLLKGITALKKLSNILCSSSF